MPQTLGAGELQPAWVEFKNTGTATWEPGIDQARHDRSRSDRDSALSSPDWLRANRAATVDAETKPGETGPLHLLAARPGGVVEREALTEHFGLVQEGVAWFPARRRSPVDVTMIAGGGAGLGPAGFDRRRRDADAAGTLDGRARRLQRAAVHVTARRRRASLLVASRVDTVRAAPCIVLFG